MLPDDTTGGGGAGTGATAPVLVPDDLKGHLSSAKVIKGIGGNPDTLLIAISGIDTTPINANWKREPRADVPGYVAFAVQEDPLDRLFFGLAASSVDGSTSAIVAGDGGQFNTASQGTTYARTGAYTPPDATGPGSGNGQVSYKGKYAGLWNGGGARNIAKDIVGRPNTVPEEVPGQAVRVTGDVFVNANFADNQINGVIKGRVAQGVAVTNDPADPRYRDGVALQLENVVLTITDIQPNGTFSGSSNRPGIISPNKDATGKYGGVIGGANGSSIAGSVFMDEKVYNDADTKIEGAIERGVFVLDQCGLTATAGESCTGTAPEYTGP
ncbi:hypothetical protein [Pseudorhodobacter sp.]|uniref:hypothetical protein n=1 Tax=Pseudorhodobacter sp. TaxID=1934400 RepID=UPI00264A310F|nr:hypothetical protein [Pseudorhodobacter sp.]MDN5785883.1 hypothetical protein [Pseudorhodobacter sp.]